MTTANTTTVSQIKAENLTFGVEFETHIPAGAIPVGGYHSPLRVRALPGWTVERDGSIECDESTREPAEFVSPKPGNSDGVPLLQGADGIRQVIKAIAYIKSIGGQVNESCGFHVHVGTAGLADNHKAIDRLVGNVAYFERGLYAASGTKTRENGRPGRMIFCKTVRNDPTLTTRHKERDAAAPAQRDRYCLLNTTKLRSRGAVEFRVFSGTLDATKAIAYISLALGMVLISLNGKRQPPWMPSNTDSYATRATGKAELQRMLKGLGWVKGDRPEPNGFIEDPEFPTLATLRTTITKLATRYDGPDQGTNEETNQNTAAPSWETVSLARAYARL